MSVVSDYFKNTTWSLLGYLNFRERSDSFTGNKEIEHRMYIKNLAYIVTGENSRDREQALNCQKTFQPTDYALVRTVSFHVDTRIADRLRLGPPTDYALVRTVSFHVDTRIADRLRLGPVSVSYVLLWVTVSFHFDTRIADRLRLGPAEKDSTGVSGFWKTQRPKQRQLRYASDVLDSATTDKETGPQIVNEEIDHILEQKLAETVSTDTDNDRVDWLLDTEKKPGNITDIDDLTTIEKNANEIIILSDKSLEEIWELVMDRLKKSEIKVQAIESRIIDLTNWTMVEWTRILKSDDKSALVRSCQKKLLKNKIDKRVTDFFRKTSDLRTCDDLKKWEVQLESINSEDGKLASQIVSFFHKCIRREVNVLAGPLRERDYIVKILSPLLGDLFEEFDSGRFRIFWIEKSSKAVSSRKRRKIHADYTKLNSDSTQVDMMLELRDYGVELMSTEVGNTEMHVDDVKLRSDHTALKIELKDMLDYFRDRLYFTKDDFTGIFTIGVQVSGHHWSVYSLSYDYHSKFYFFAEMATLNVPTTLSTMDAMLDNFIEGLLGLRHTMLSLNKKISSIAKSRYSTPPPPSSPQHETSETPEIKRVKKDGVNVSKETGNSSTLHRCEIYAFNFLFISLKKGVTSDRFAGRTEMTCIFSINQKE
ncbi:hypothetical protein G9A89_017214 [Geosiphon pyriformis]|nr:hypothetical protein G9A89_017214 [Geosiphon pyriformis]